jgi:CheY-like chemotaxis protein
MASVVLWTPVQEVQCLIWADERAAWDDTDALMRQLLGDRRFFRFVAAGTAGALAVVYLVSSDRLRDRMDDTFLVLLAAAAVIALVPWERLTSLTAGQFEFVLERPQVAGALRGLETSRVEDKEVRRLLTELAPQIETIAGSRVLWIDDVPYSVLGERRLLRALGVDVIPARSSEEALGELAKDNDFDLVITDVQRHGSSYKRVETGGPVIDTREEDGYLTIKKADGTTLYDIHEGVNFVVAELRKYPDESVRALPVVFYASYPMDDLVEFTEIVPDAPASNSVDGLLSHVIPALTDARENPIKVPRAKKPTGI